MRPMRYSRVERHSSRVPHLTEEGYLALERKAENKNESRAAPRGR